MMHKNNKKKDEKLLTFQLVIFSSFVIITVTTFMFIFIYLHNSSPKENLINLVPKNFETGKINETGDWILIRDDGNVTFERYYDEPSILINHTSKDANGNSEYHYIFDKTDHIEFKFSMVLDFSDGKFSDDTIIAYSFMNSNKSIFSLGYFASEGFGISINETEPLLYSPGMTSNISIEYNDGYCIIDDFSFYVSGNNTMIEKVSLWASNCGCSAYFHSIVMTIYN